MNPTLLAIQNIFGGLFVALLNTLIPACLLALTAWTVFRLFPNVSAAVRYGAWWAVLIAVLAMPFTPRIFNFQYRFIDAIPSPQATPVNAPSGPTSLPDALRPKPTAFARKSASGPSVIFLTQESLRTATAIPEATKPSLLDTLRSSRLKLPAGNWVLWIASIWLVAALWRIARIARSYGYLRTVLTGFEAAPTDAQARLAYWTAQRKIQRAVRLLLSDQATGPMAVGVFGATIVIPTSLFVELSQEELDHVLLHELAHIVRRDDWTNLLARLVGVVADLHPVAAYALHQIAENRELACDDWVVSTTGEPHSYAAALARVFELSHPSTASIELATGMADHPSPSHLGTRIGYLLKQGRRFTSHVPLKVWAMQVITLAGLVLLGAQSPRWVAMAQVTPAPATSKPSSTSAPKSKGTTTAPQVAQAASTKQNRAVQKAPPPARLNRLRTELKNREKALESLRERRSRSSADSREAEHIDTEIRVIQLNIAQLERDIVYAQTARTAPTVGNPNPPTLVFAKGPELLAAERDVTQISVQLTILRQKYTEAHPQVKAAKNILAAATTNRDALAQEYEASVQAAPPPTTSAQLQRNLVATQNNMLRLQADLAHLETEHQLLLERYDPTQASFKDLEQKIAALRAEKAAVTQQLDQLKQTVRAAKGSFLGDLSQISQRQQVAAQKAEAAAQASKLFSAQLDSEHKKAGPPDTARIIELQKKLLAGREAEIAAWKDYAGQLPGGTAVQR